MSFLQGLFEDETFEGSAAAEGDIGLAVGESAAAEIDNDTVEILPWLCGWYRPGKHERILLEATDDFGMQLAAFDKETENLPGEGRDLDDGAIGQFGDDERFGPARTSMT